MYTCIFACEGRYDRTLPVAFALIAFQDQQSFEWVFDSFMKSRDNESFETFFTDQDPAIAAAFAKIFPSVMHLLCIWHICSQNLPKNLKRYSLGKLLFPSRLHYLFPLHLSLPLFHYEVTSLILFHCDTGNSFELLKDKLWAFAMSNKDYSEHSIALEWADIVTFSNHFLADPLVKDREAFQNYIDAHYDDPRIPLSKHLYFNKLWGIRSR